MTYIHNHLIPLSTWTVEDSNLMKKLELERKNLNPTSTMIRQNLGPKLADAIFDDIDQESKELFGIGKELAGAGDEVWTQPKRQLMGEIIMEPYPTRRHRQALTHRAILEYGAKCMEEWENKVMFQNDETLKDKIQEMEEKMKVLLEEQINETRKKEREDYLTRIAMMEERLEERHKREIEALERKLSDEYEARIAEVMDTMNKNFKCETENLLNATKQLLTNRFHFKLTWMKADLEEDYRNKLCAEVKSLESKMKRVMDSKKCLEDDSSNDMMSKVVCAACLTAQFLITEFKEKIKKLQKEIDDLIECNISLENEIECLANQNGLLRIEIQAWECVMRHLVKEYQKFIEFHLKLPPGESSYLISWEKMIDLKNEIFAKITMKKMSKQTSLLQKDKSIELEIKREKTISLSMKSIEFCYDKDIISIISSIIRRVIPSLPDVASANDEVNSILESIIRRVIPSLSSVEEEEEEIEEETSCLEKIDRPIELSGKLLCPKVLRTEYICTGRGEEKEEESQADSTPKIEKTLEEQLTERVGEITRIIDYYPNIMKFIQGP